MRGAPPFALSLSKGEGRAWFDRLTTNEGQAVPPEEGPVPPEPVSKGEGALRCSP